MRFKKRAKEIIALKKEDDALREQLIKEGQLGEGYNTEMEQIHIKNAQHLEKIIAEMGYPTAEKVGEEASNAAWLIIQHAIGQPAFMRKCAKLLKNEVNQGVGNPLNLAYLIDRIAVFEGKLQPYGTQFDWDENGELCPMPMENINLVNQRRISLGLPSIEEQIKHIRKRTLDEGQTPPDDLSKRKQEMEAWKKKVGWIV